jgi:hypothetical protein
MTGFIWLSIGFSGRLCEHGNKPLVCMKGREFLCHLSNCQLLKKELISYAKISERNVSNIFQLLKFAICGFSTIGITVYTVAEKFLT